MRWGCSTSRTWAGLLVTGPEAEAFLEAVLTRRVSDLGPSQIRYSLICNESGGVLDDVLVYHLAAEDDSSESAGYGLVVNASNREKVIAHITPHTEGRDVVLRDATNDWAMLAVQGPAAIQLLDPLMGHELTSLRYYNGAWTAFEDLGECYVTRTGYTGEDGCEMVCRNEAAAAIWERLLALAEAAGGMAVGLGARDTLRLEAGMPLYGHELTEEINPIQAGLGFAVNLHGRTFVGSEALAEATRSSSQPVRVGLQMEGRRVARQGAVVLMGGSPVGEITSGTFSPTLEIPLAMAIVKPQASAPGTRLDVDIRGVVHEAQVVPLPFYSRGQ